MSSLANNGLPRKRSRMTIKRKRAAALALAAGLLLLSLTGCGGQSIPAGGTGIISPVVINYTINNPLTIEEHREGDGEEFDYDYITIDGLKDENVEQSINNRIKEVFDGLRVQDLPPYRGIKAAIEEDAVITREQIFTNVTGNFNHILSISMSKYVSYQNPSDRVYPKKERDYYTDMVHLSEVETLNFDLNTGKEISLKDLFCDDVDYMDLINDHMSRYLAENNASEEGYYSFYYSGLKQVESFKGLSENQKFAVYPYGIALVFDYETPQFDTEFSAVTVMFNFSEFGDRIAVTERFYSEEENIFTSEEPAVKALAIKEMNYDVSGNDSRQDGNVYIYRYWRWSSDLPAEIRNRLEEMLTVDQQAVDEANKFFQGMSEAEINEKCGASHDVSVYVNRFGRYINISKRSSLYMPYTAREMSEYHCYDSDSMEEIGLADLFKEGYDYKPVILDAIRKTMVEYGAASEKDAAEMDEAVVDRIEGFNLDIDAISMVVTYEAPEREIDSFYLYIPYTDFGCDNMNIFR